MKTINDILSIIPINWNALPSIMRHFYYSSTFYNIYLSVKLRSHNHIYFSPLKSQTFAVWYSHKTFSATFEEKQTKKRQTQNIPQRRERKWRNSLKMLLQIHGAINQRKKRSNILTKHLRFLYLTEFRILLASLFMVYLH